MGVDRVGVAGISNAAPFLFLFCRIELGAAHALAMHPGVRRPDAVEAVGGLRFRPG
jgi:hypothetical protein